MTFVEIRGRRGQTAIVPQNAAKTMFRGVKGIRATARMNTTAAAQALQVAGARGKAGNAWYRGTSARRARRVKRAR